MFDAAIIILYLIIITYIGIKASKKTKSQGGFFQTSENYSIFAVIAALTSGFLGGGYSVGNAAGSYKIGIGYSVALCGFAVGIIAFSVFIIPKIKTKEKTLSGAVKSSFGSSAGHFTAFFSFLFCTGIVAAQLSTLGIILSEYFGFSKSFCIVVSATLIIVYSTIGGINAVVKTDIAQFIILAIGIPLLFIFSLNALKASPNEFDYSMLKFPYNQEKISPEAFLSLFIAFGVGEMITPQFIQRINLNKSKKKMVRGVVISGILSALFFIIIGLIGVFGKQIMPNDIPQNILVKMAVKVMPIGLNGVVGASLCAILISSADSSLNSASEALAKDFLGEIFPNKNKIKNVRLINLICGFIAVVLVVTLPDVMEILMTSYKFWAPVIFSQAVYSIIGKKGSAALFYIPAISGILGVVIWDSVFKTPFDISSVTVGFFINIITFTVAEITEKLFLKRRKSLNLKESYL